MQYQNELSTSQLRKIMNDYVTKLANAEHFKVLDSWYLVRYGTKLLIFNRVTSQRWKCSLDRMDN